MSSSKLGELVVANSTSVYLFLYLLKVTDRYTRYRMKTLARDHKATSYFYSKTKTKVINKNIFMLLLLRMTIYIYIYFYIIFHITCTSTLVSSKKYT